MAGASRSRARAEPVLSLAKACPRHNGRDARATIRARRAGLQFFRNLSWIPRQYLKEMCRLAGFSSALSSVELATPLFRIRPLSEGIIDEPLSIQTSNGGGEANTRVPQGRERRDSIRRGLGNTHVLQRCTAASREMAEAQPRDMAMLLLKAMKSGSRTLVDMRGDH